MKNNCHKKWYAIALAVLLSVNLLGTAMLPATPVYGANANGCQRKTLDIMTSDNKNSEEMTAERRAQILIQSGYTPITDIAGLQGINNNLKGKYVLMNDIDMSETAPGKKWDTGHGWTPIGSKSSNFNGFEGILDGNGHYIKNMNIYGSDTDVVGLFSRVSGTISNLGLVDCNISVSAVFAGGITGETIYYSIISNCFVTGNIVMNPKNDEPSVGGIIGNHNVAGNITDCFNYATIQLNTTAEVTGGYAGGIAGSDWGLTSRCYNAGSVSGTGQTTIGGICGRNINDNAVNSFYLKSSVQSTAANALTTQGTALTDSQMRETDVFIGFDFANTWYIDLAGDYNYPQLRICPLRRITSCELTANPKRTEYVIGDDFDSAGGVLSLVYENGTKSSVALENSMISGYDKSKLGTQELKITYAGATMTFPVTVKEVVAKSIKLNQEKCTINRGERVTLTAVFTPANTTNQELVWSTDNELVAAVSANGTVQGLNSGTATITATLKTTSNTATTDMVLASCVVTVKVYAKKMRLNVTKLTLRKGQKKSIKVTLTPFDAEDTISWITSNSKIASVNKTGTITARKRGTAMVVAKASGGLSKKVTIIVK